MEFAWRLLCWLALVIVVAGESQQEAGRACVGHVEDLNTLQFWRVSRDAPALVEFYSSRCPHSKAFAPEFSCVASKVQRLDMGVQVVRILAGQPGLGEFTQHGVPTVRFFAKGLHSSGIEYSGLRQAQAITAWAQKLANMRPRQLIRQYPTAFPPDALRLARGEEPYEVQTVSARGVASGPTSDLTASDSSKRSGNRYVSLPSETITDIVTVPRADSLEDGAEEQAPVVVRRPAKVLYSPAEFRLRQNLARVQASAELRSLGGEPTCAATMEDAEENE